MTYVDLPSQKYLVLFDLKDDLSLVGLESYFSLVGLGLIMTSHYKSHYDWSSQIRHYDWSSQISHCDRSSQKSF